MSFIRRSGGALLCAVLVLGLTACGSSVSPPDEWSEGGDTFQMAGSVSERIKNLLEYHADMDQSQRQMLERALANEGEVSHADYLTAWDNYRQCLIAKGYNPPTMRLINGVYIHQTKIDTSGMSEAQQDKLNRDVDGCQARYVLSVDDIYRLNVANPGLYSNPDVALVDCLRRHALVPKDYSVDQYRAESERFFDTDVSDTKTEREAYTKRREAFSFDFNAPQARTCVVTNDSSLLIDELEAWKPLS